MKPTKRFTVRLKDADGCFGEFDSKENAIICLKALEVDDKADGIYEPDCYEVYDELEQKVVL